MTKHRVKRMTDEKIVLYVILAMLGMGALLATLPLILAGAIGFVIYQLVAKQKRLPSQNPNPRLQDLKGKIKRADRQVSLLEDYQSQKEYTQYGVLARQLLPQLKTIQNEADQLKEDMGQEIYQRVSKKVTQVTGEITTELNRLGLSTDSEPLDPEEERVLQLAPELLTCYRNIRMDDRIIREKIKTSPNQSELSALHDANMNRFEDILSGYLNIKASPKDFYQAQERLERAKTALEQFDLDLDDTLKELNEKELSDFEVSLRLMSQKERKDEN